MKNIKLKIKVFLVLTIFIAKANSQEFPILNFSDLISGANSGLDDGLGSGTIVTIWGQNLGSTQGGSTIVFTDSNDVEYSPAYIYYWKDANGVSPGAKSNLYKSHKMQEIAFSIPSNATSGIGKIVVNVNGMISNPIIFTVRNGGIYHIKASGDDISGDGSFLNPWLSVNKALNTAITPGVTLFVHDSLIIGSVSTEKAVYWNKPLANSNGYENQYAIVAYPGSQPEIIGHSGISIYKTQGMVASKLNIKASLCDELNGQPLEQVNDIPKVCKKKSTYGIRGTAYGRIVGNTITDRPGGCANGQQAAIVAGAGGTSGPGNTGFDRISGLQILGNEIYDYGCTGSSKFHHTTYFSIRNKENLQVDPWRLGWNYLHDNLAKNGIHSHDEGFSGDSCGSPNETVVIRDNVIVNQGGAGINASVKCPESGTWTNDFKIYNNLLINTGLLTSWDGIDMTSSDGPVTNAISINDKGFTGTFDIYNNTIFDWNSDDANRSSKACLGLTGFGLTMQAINFNSNVCITEKDKSFLGLGSDAQGVNSEIQLAKVSGSDNVLFYDGIGVLAIEPELNGMLLLDDTILNDPEVSIVENIDSINVVIDNSSNIIGASNVYTLFDLYGNSRGSVTEPGAVAFSSDSNVLIFNNGFE